MADEMFFLQMKCARIVDKFARRAHISLAGALDFFYQSEEYTKIKEDLTRLEEVVDDDVVEALMKVYSE